MIFYSFKNIFLIYKRHFPLGFQGSLTVAFSQLQVYMLSSER